MIVYLEFEIHDTMIARDILSLQDFSKGIRLEELHLLLKQTVMVRSCLFFAPRGVAISPCSFVMNYCTILCLQNSLLP